MPNCSNSISDFEFTKEEIDDAVKNNKLLSIEIEFNQQCNLRCPYCYVSENPLKEEDLTKEEILDVIKQAKELGAKKIVILGGEPMVYPDIMYMIKFIIDLDLKVEMFTNGFKIDDKVAKQLFDLGVNISLKINSFDGNIQDTLAGKKDYHKVIWNTFNSLKKAGYPSPEAFLAVSTIICKQNINELIDMWKWLRDQNIIPYFEIITPQGNAKSNEWLKVDSQQLYEVFSKIAEIDRTYYGKIWDPQPPIVGTKCLRHQFSCMINSKGYVHPCVGVSIPVGNIKEKKLSNILRESEIIQDYRNYRNMIKGPCHSCEKADSCYGCRGAAYQLTGDYLASDPMCWKNKDRQKEILGLPFAVDTVIPHKAPMKLVDTLVKVTDGAGDIIVKVSNDMIFINDDGVLDEAVYLELMAQATAALRGFKQMASNVVPKGYLLGAKDLKILGSARVGDILKISVVKYAQFDNFYIMKGVIYKGNDIIAAGDLKIFHETSGNNINDNNA